MRPLILALILAMTGPTTAHAGDREAEVERLREEIAGLAARNAWKGVERNYGKLVKLEMPLEAGDHLLGAQAAQSLGDMALAVERLELAVVAATPDEKAATAQAAASEQLQGVLQRYGKVEISVGSGRLPGLVRFVNPFAPEERDAIQRAREAIIAKGAYHGLLPVGEYMIDGQKFEIVSSDVWQVIKVE